MLWNENVQFNEALRRERNPHRMWQLLQGTGHSKLPGTDDCAQAVSDCSLWRLPSSCTCSSASSLAFGLLSFDPEFFLHRI